MVYRIRVGMEIGQKLKVCRLRHQVSRALVSKLRKVGTGRTKLMIAHLVCQPKACHVGDR
ncbi:MAG: hypothetical protein ICV55_04900 [Coleofasciculus sp. C3-bin4]|jgi:hypothetical protein|nr:hypothetical protein [Coleofasciculus sp. C3-bin4]